MKIAPVFMTLTKFLYPKSCKYLFSLAFLFFLPCLLSVFSVYLIYSCLPPLYSDFIRSIFIFRSIPLNSVSCGNFQSVSPVYPFSLFSLFYLLLLSYRFLTSFSLGVLVIVHKSLCLSIFISLFRNCPQSKFPCQHFSCAFLSSLRILPSSFFQSI